MAREREVEAHMTLLRRATRYILAPVALVGLAVHEPLWTPLAAVTIGNLLVGDHFPFSHFPMYSGFSTSTYYVYLADEHGDPVATRRLGLTTTTLKKVYRAEVGTEHRGLAVVHLSPERLGPAGRRTLAYVRRVAGPERAPDGLGILRLHQVNLSLGPDGLRREVFQVAEG